MVLPTNSPSSWYCLQNISITLEPEGISWGSLSDQEWRCPRSDISDNDESSTSEAWSKPGCCVWRVKADERKKAPKWFCKCSKKSEFLKRGNFNRARRPQCLVRPWRRVTEIEGSTKKDYYDDFQILLFLISSTLGKYIRYRILLFKEHIVETILLLCSDFLV